MIVLKHNGTVYIAKSCWCMRDTDEYVFKNPNEDNLSVWHPNRRRQRLVATTGSGRMVDIIRYENVFPSVLDKKHLFVESYGKMCAISDRFGMYDGTKIPKHTVFAEGDRAFVVAPDGAILEVEDVYLHTCNDNAAMGIYDRFGADDPYEFFRKAFTGMEITERYVMFPVIVMNTKNNKIEVIER